MSRTAVAVLALALLAATLGMTGTASAATPCTQIGTVYGIPPWGFHTGPYTEGESFAKGHGNINLAANTVSGVMCQQDRAGVIIMSVQHHLVYHSHYAMMWGYPGNIIKIKFRVTSSTDPNCAVGTVGRATLYASSTACAATASSSSSRRPAGTRTTYTTERKLTTRSRRYSRVASSAESSWSCCIGQPIGGRLNPAPRRIRTTP